VLVLALAAPVLQIAGSRFATGHLPGDEIS